MSTKKVKVICIECVGSGVNRKGTDCPHCRGNGVVEISMNNTHSMKA